MQRGDLLRGRFELGEVAREGGMGVVFRALDRATGRPVALKTLLDASPASVERFEREASLLARLKHDAVVAYVAHGVGEDGAPFLAMDWLEGEDLADRLARGPLTEAEARALTLRLAEALGAAHALGIVHRDVKPANVVLVGGEVARGTLIDFGAALSGDGPRRTRTGLIIGTPGYMAPEQARASRVIDARADVYALGCVLYECLTGRPPFVGAHPVAVLAKVLLEEAPRLGAVSPGAPADLDRLLVAMLAKEPGERPPDGAAVARALELEDGAMRESLRAEASVLPESITDAERVVVHVVLAAQWSDPSDPLGRTIVDAAPLDTRELERRFDVAVDVVADGSVLATVKPGALGPKGGAMRAAALARELVRATGGPAALASGLARVERGLPLGEVVDRAVELAHAAARAAAVGVVTDELTASLLRGAWAAKDDGGLRLLADGPTPPGHARALVGRERELGTLTALFEEVATERASRVALVTASPGGGKSRLLAELVLRLTDGDEAAAIEVVGCDETTRETPLGAAAELARRVGQVGVGSASERRDALGRFVERGAAAGSDPAADRRLMDFVGELVGATVTPSLALLAARTDAMTMGDQTTRAFVDLLARACSTEPLVLVVDDLQWCDRASLRLLEAAARELEARPLFFCAAARPEVDDVFPTAFAERALTRLSVAALGRRAAEALVRDVAGERVPATAVAEIVARGEGNPFLLEELARGAREGRPMDAVGGTTAVVAARFEALSADARRVLRAASVVGQRPTVVAVAAIVGARVDAPWLSHAWAELERAAVLTARDGAPAFRHALLRDAAYATLTDEDKTLAHKLAARFFEETGADPMTVATHADLAGETELAARAFVDAAQAAFEASDFTAAAARAASAERCGASGALLGRADRVRAEASFWSGDLRDAEAHGRRALELLEPPSPDFFVAAAMLIAACARLGLADAALAHTRRVLVERADEVSEPARAVALLTAASFLPLQGQIDLAKAILRDVRPTVDRLAETHPMLAARYFRSHSICAMASGDIGGYIAGARAAAGRFAALDDRRNELAQRGNLTYGLVEVGDYAAAVREGRQVIETAAKMGLRNVVALAKQNVGYALMRGGAPAEGIATLGEALAEFEAQGHIRMAGGTRIYLALACLAGGLESEAGAHVERALDLLATTPPLRAYALALASRVQLLRGDVEGAVAAAEEALSLLDSLGSVDSGEIDLYLAVARARLAVSDHAGARAVLERGREVVRTRAARLDEAQRETFLGRVEANVQLLALAGKTLCGG